MFYSIDSLIFSEEEGEIDFVFKGGNHIGINKTG